MRTTIKLGQNMLRAEIHGELLEDPVACTRAGGKQYTTAKVLAATFGGGGQLIHVVCYQEVAGERLRKLGAGDPVSLKGHLTVKHTEGQRSSIGLNVRSVHKIESKF